MDVQSFWSMGVWCKDNIFSDFKMHIGYFGTAEKYTEYMSDLNLPWCEQNIKHSGIIKLSWYIVT